MCELKCSAYWSRFPFLYTMQGFAKKSRQIHKSTEKQNLMKKAFFLLFLCAAFIAPQAQTFEANFIKHEEQTRASGESEWITKGSVTQERDVNGRVSTQKFDGTLENFIGLDVADSVQFYYSLGSKDSILYYKKDPITDSYNLIRTRTFFSTASGSGQRVHLYAQNAPRVLGSTYEEVENTSGLLAMREYKYYSLGQVTIIDRRRFQYDNVSRVIGHIDSAFSSAENAWTVRATESRNYNAQGLVDSIVLVWPGIGIDEIITTHDYASSGLLNRVETHYVYPNEIEPNSRKVYSQYQDTRVGVIENYGYDELLDQWVKSFDATFLYDSEQRLISETRETRISEDDVRFIYEYEYPTGLKDFSEDVSILAFPNPVMNFLTIVSSKQVESASVVNMQGQVLSLEPISNGLALQLDVSNLTSGTYELLIRSADGFSSKAFVKY